MHNAPRRMEGFIVWVSCKLRAATHGPCLKTSNKNITPLKIPLTANEISSWTENRCWLLFTQTASASLWPEQFSFTIAALHLITIRRAKVASREPFTCHYVRPLHAITCRWKYWSSDKNWGSMWRRERETSSDRDVWCKMLLQNKNMLTCQCDVIGYDAESEKHERTACRYYTRHA